MFLPLTQARSSWATVTGPVPPNVKLTLLMLLQGSSSSPAAPGWMR
jgi:hypothetical protein